MRVTIRPSKDKRTAQFVITPENEDDKRDLTNIAHVCLLPNVLRDGDNLVQEVVFSAPLIATPLRTRN